MDERAIARQRERSGEIEAAVADVRAIEIKQRFIRLAARQELFTSGGKRNSCLYRVSEDGDHRFALYVNSSFGNIREARG